MDQILQYVMKHPCEESICTCQSASYISTAYLSAVRKLTFLVSDEYRFLDLPSFFILLYFFIFNISVFQRTPGSKAWNFLWVGTDR